MTDGPKGLVAESEGLPTALMQARYALRDYNIKQPGCGFDKLAHACDLAAQFIEATAAKDAEIEAFKDAQRQWEFNLASLQEQWCEQEVRATKAEAELETVVTEIVAWLRAKPNQTCIASAVADSIEKRWGPRAAIRTAPTTGAAG